MKKYPNSVMKGLMTGLLFVMVIVTVFGFLVTAAAVSGKVYDTPKEELWIEVSASLYRNFRQWAIYNQVVSVVSDAVNAVYALRYAAPFLCIGGLILTVLLFCLLMCSAGHKNGAQEITLSKFDRIPLEIAAVMMIGIPVVLHFLIYELVRSTTLGSWFFRADPVELSMFALLLSPFVYALCHTLAVRFKSKTFWTNTLVYRLGPALFVKIFHTLKNARHAEPRWYDRIPLEIVLLAVLPVGLLVLNITDILLDSFFTDYPAILFLILSGSGILYILVYMALVRYRLGTLWTNTLLYRLSGKLPALYGFFCRTLPLTWRTAIVVVLYCLFNFLVFAFANDPREVAFQLFLCSFPTLLIGALLIYGSWATHTITQSIRDMANGDIRKKTDPSNLFFIFRKQAEGLNSLGDGLQTAVQAQMKSERFKTELITNVSHDIKTPLTSIINYSDLLLAELGHEIQPDGKAAEYANTIYRHSLRLKKLTEDLVEASKASSGAIAVNFERIELNQMLRQAVGEYEERLLRAQLTPVCRFTEEDIFISADGRLLWRVFDNLCSNIVKYSLPGTRVYITLTKTGDHAIVSFKNISRDTLNVDAEDLLERFVRGDASRHSEGSGLGLNIALSLCDRMNGKLTLACDGDLFKADVEFETLK